MPTSDEFEDMPLSDALDNMILMHRDAHFSGNFDAMLDYYHKEGKGISQEFDLERIQTLAHLEKKSGQNMAGSLLSGAQAEHVARAKESYKNLRDLYDTPKVPRQALLIADLVLAEEENPEKEIAAIVAEKSGIVRSLIEVLRAEDLYDPLFPGYGHAPALAAKCLGIIGDKRAIFYLFENIGDEDVFNEEIILDALKAIGEPAKEFLLKILHSKPINFDNERAATALIHFKDDPQVAEACLQLLSDPLVLSHETFATYLTLACEGLTDKEKQQQFRNLSTNPNLSESLRRDINIITKSWPK
jgi:hypothetical protein